MSERSYFDMMVQETDGDVSVIDEQAELFVDGTDRKWRGTVDIAHGAFRLILKQDLLVVGEMPTSFVNLTTGDGNEIGAIEPTVGHTAGVFSIQGLQFADSAVGNALTLSVDVLNADGETLATEQVTTTVRTNGAERDDSLVSLEDVHVYGLAVAGVPTVAAFVSVL